MPEWQKAEGLVATGCAAGGWLAGQPGMRCLPPPAHRPCALIPQPPLPHPAQVREIAALHDPCPLPDKLKKRSLNERERLLYAPMSGEGAGGRTSGEDC